MQAPTATDLLKEALVQQALEKAWTDSFPGDSLLRHEEGGWIYMDTATGSIAVRRAPAGGQTTLDLSTPPLVPGAMVVATFHTVQPGVLRDGNSCQSG